MMNFILLFLAHLSIASSATGEISGNVYSHKDHALMPGVHIELYQDKQLIDETFSAVDGQFTFSDVPDGTYDIRFKFVGKKKKKINNVLVEAGKNTELEVIYPKEKIKD